MKRIIMLATMLAMPFLAMGQFTLSGKVTDSKTGEALPGAGIRIEGTFRAASCGSKGDFEFLNMKKGQCILLVSFIGYKSQEKQIEITGDQSVEIKLEQSPVMQDEVIITATRAGDKSPTAYKNIDRAEIQRMNLGQDVPYVLDQTPSAVVSSDAGSGVGYTGLRIRGSDLTRINVTVNGIPLNDPESQGVFWVDFPDLASSIDNVQIQRGVGTSSNGAAAFGASINFQTTKLNAEPYAETNNSYGSFNTWKNNLLAGTGLIDGKWTFDGRISRISSDGYIDRAKSNMNSFFLSGGYYGAKNFLRINVFSGKEKTYQAWTGVPKDSLETNRTYNPFTYKNQTDNYRQTNYQLLYGQEAGKYWNINAALHFTRGRGYYEEYHEHALLASYNMSDLIIGPETMTNSDLITQQWLDNYFYGMTFSANHDNRKHLKLTFGGAVNRYHGGHYGDVTWAQYSFNNETTHRWYDNLGIKTDVNAYAKANYLIGKHLHLFADLQWRYVSQSIDGKDAFARELDQAHASHFVNPKAGVYYEISKMHKTYLSFAISNREPNRNNYADANPALPKPVPEKLYDIEMGYELDHSMLAANLNLFYMLYHDQLVLTGDVNDVGYPVMTNVPVSYRAGAEITASLTPARWFRWDMNAAYSMNKIKDFTEFVDAWDTAGNYYQQKNLLRETDIAFSPALVAGSQLRFKPFKGFEASLISKYVGKQYIDNTSNNARSLHTYFVNNVLLSYTIKTKFIKEIGLNFMVNNLLNVKYETNAWVYRYLYAGEEYTQDGYFPQAGMNFLGGVTLKF